MSIRIDGGVLLEAKGRSSVAPFVARPKARMSSTSKGHILVVDDELQVRSRLSACLTDGGYQVSIAESGDAALVLFRNTHPDLVICDLHMPLLNGLDVLRAITGESPETPVIVASAQGSMEDVVAALRNGAVDYLLKPVELEVLQHAVRRALERGQLLRQNKEILHQLELTNAELERSLDLLEEDQEAGRRVQQRMLPPTPHVFGENCHCSHRVFPSLYLSGDFVDYFSIAPDRIGFYLADVSGHGASSAFVTVFLKTLMNRIQRHYEKKAGTGVLSPARLMRDINQELIAMGMGKHLAMLCGVIDLSANELLYCVGAHHPPPILINDGKAQVLAGTGLPLGIFADASYEDITVQLGKSFSLVAMSDGILEVLSDKMMDEKEAHLLAIVGQDHADANALADAFALSNSSVVPDDVALLVIKRSE